MAKLIVNCTFSIKPKPATFKKMRLFLFASLGLIGTSIVPNVLAQSNDEQRVEKITVTGTRTDGLTAIDSPVQVDMILVADGSGQSGGEVNLTLLIMLELQETRRAWCDRQVCKVYPQILHWC